MITYFDIFYSVGKYSFPDNFNAALIPNGRGLISSGDWDSFQVPFFESNEYDRDNRDLFVSVGAEVTASLPLVEQFEPTKLGLLTLKNGTALIAGTHEERALHKLRARPGAVAMEHDIFDVVGVAKAVLEFSSTPLTCLAIGAKPHALALGLAALSSESVEITCRLPAAYVTADVMPTGDIFRYQIKDRFDPAAYL